jgi:hypothetical protein
VTLDYYDRSDLKASQRAFSKNQDHRAFTKGFNNNTNTPVSGVDLRLNWGYPALVQARTGTLTGMSVGGLNTPLALVPEGAAQTPALGSFIAVGPTSYNATTGAPVRSDPKLGKACACRSSRNAATDNSSAAVTTPLGRSKRAMEASPAPSTAPGEIRGMLRPTLSSLRS